MVFLPPGDDKATIPVADAEFSQAVNPQSFCTGVSLHHPALIQSTGPLIDMSDIRPGTSTHAPREAAPPAQCVLGTAWGRGNVFKNKRKGESCGRAGSAVELEPGHLARRPPTCDIGNLPNLTPLSLGVPT